MLLSFTQHLQEEFPEVFESKSLIAISGGIDSVVLAHLSKQIGLNFALAHCNFGLRGEESQADEDFVITLADALETDVYVQSFQTESYAAQEKISIQMAARELRYQWFEELRKSLRFEYVLTAHHANDDFETLLMNLIRGTGLEGLTGIPKRNQSVRRPLLAFTREEIEKFAKTSRIQWREDRSNQTLKYLRNRIRHEVVPVLQEMNPHLLDSFRKTRLHLRESSALIENYMAALFPKVAREEEFGYSFQIKLLKTIPNLRAVLVELFRSFGFTQWDDMYDLLDAQSGKIVYSKTHRLIKDRETILLTTLPEEESKEYPIEEEEEVAMLPVGTFHFNAGDTFRASTAKTVKVDKSKLQFPLMVRKWRRGDYFYPIGLQGKKKLSKFFKDEKFSLPQKERCNLLCSGDCIVWVVGYRLDDRYKVTKETKEILSITYTS